ncbi:TPA: hypothetical protein U2M23_002156 [Providencia stuartii]|nr:Uncharacterised protein [Providencia stuartii]HEM8184979.1 hypothetical protein [Providencia stuartii]HEM8189354.1 hypothetical protein [Providencia stuartii]HEM8219509.1 hypothetical protein [Providencia stuartii]
MEKLTLLDKRRKHFIDATFDYLKRKKKASTFERTVDGIKYRVDLDAEVLKQSLINLYENNICRKEAGATDQQIMGVYDSFYTKNGTLSNDGKDFISVITKLIAENLHQKEMNK